MKPLTCIAAASLFAIAAGAAQADPGCRASSGPEAPTVVELYTSEGCSSCPPADRWLSGLRGRSDVLALAFHVDYWDRLGWPDPFAQPSFTARQWQLARRDGARQVYTPQVRVDGRDWRGWPALPRAAAPSAVPGMSLQREADHVRVNVAALAGAGPALQSLQGYWAVLEDHHSSRVSAGENRGETLRHDHVVRLFQPVPEWNAAAGLQAALKVSAGDAAFPRRVAFVVTNGAGRPLQALALALAC